MLRQRSRRLGHRKCFAYLFAASFLATASVVFAIDDNLTKGATNNHVFESGVWGESIDNLNGGLNLTIPLGPVYRVSPDVSYQLQLSYSSKIWQMNKTNYKEFSRSRLTGRGQAGLGFMLQMGRRYVHSSAADCTMYETVFQDPTGAEHPSQVGVSPDGSYYLTDPGTPSITTPSGVRYVLGHRVDDLLTEGVSDRFSVLPACASLAQEDVDPHSNDYRGDYITRIEGKDVGAGGAVNHVDITYADADGMRHLMSSITDSLGRTITFDNTKTFGAQTLSMGYVKSISMPAFGGATATYTFDYELVTLKDPFVLDDPAAGGEFSITDPLNANGEFPDLLLLKSITFPQGYVMSFEYTDPNDHGNQNVGLLQARVLPTGARVEYDYGWYAFQHQMCKLKSSAGCPPPPITTGMSILPDNGGCGQVSLTLTSSCFTVEMPGTYGVDAKRIVAEPGAMRQWRYRRREFARAPVEPGGPLYTLSNPYKVITTDPYGNDTVTFYSATVASAPLDPNIATWWTNDPWWRNGLVYRTEYYRGSADAGDLVRIELQEWEDRDYTPAPPYHRGEFKRIKQSKVVYVDNGGQTQWTVNDDWDGYGHYRASTAYGFDGQPYRAKRTGYNCDTLDAAGACLPRQAHLDNWILGTYSFQETLDAGGAVVQRSEYAFDDLGYLKRRLDLATIPAGPGQAMTPGDTTVGAAGDILTQLCYEGESGCLGAAVGVRTGNLQSKTVQEFGGNGPAFSEIYTYENGPNLKTRQVEAMTWLSEDRDIDPSTGLTAVSRDPAGIATTFTYDDLGRLTAVTPAVDPAHGVEQPAVLTYPDIHTTELQQAVSANDYIYAKFSFDNLGRLVRVDKRQADQSTASQVTRYDATGRMEFQSEWFDAAGVTDASLAPGTSYDYTDPRSDPSNPASDPFGRVRKTTSADGKVTRTDYAGTSRTVIVEGVKGTCGGGTFDASTSYEQDAFGRLTQVTSPRSPDAQTCGQTALREGADAFYVYDVLDHLVQVRLEADEAGQPMSQYRNFTYL